MKKILKNAVCICLSIALLATVLTGCGGSKENAGADNGGFTVTYEYSSKEQDKLEPTLERWESLSDVPITWNRLTGDFSEALKIKFSSGDYPEVVLGNMLQAADVSNYAASGILVPLDEYISEESTPNLYEFFEKNPVIKGACTLPDGHIYSLPSYTGLMSLGLENVFYINKTWLDKLDLEVPQTIDDLHEVLKAFKPGDPNGNGEQDEIPLTFLNDSGYENLEALMGLWGKPTKSGVYEGFITIDNKKAEFTPMTDEWKEMIKFCRELYSEGLIDKECFTHTNDTFYAKRESNPSVVGFTWSATNPMGNPDEYIAIPPLKVDGYETVWRLHPGVVYGNRDLFSITTSCKNPEAAVKWIDKFFTFDQTLQNRYGNVGKVFTVDENGVYRFNEPDDGTTLAYFTTHNMVTGCPGPIYADEYGTKVEDCELWTGLEDAYKLYEPYVNLDQWPRPYYTTEDASRIGELRTDLFDLVNQKKAKWIVGTEDIDADWESYKDSLKKMGVDEYVSLCQKAYDQFHENIDNASKQ